MERFTAKWKGKSSAAWVVHQCVPMWSTTADATPERSEAPLAGGEERFQWSSERAAPGSAAAHCSRG